MKRILLPPTLLLFILAGPLSLPVAGEEPPTGRAKSTFDKEAYEKNMQELLGKLGAQLDELKKKTEAGTEQAETKMKAELAEIEKARQEAVRKLDALGRASKDSWEKFSAEAEKAVKDFERAMKRGD